MEVPNAFQGLRFERPLVRRLPRWLVSFVVVPGLFTLLWLAVPRSGMYWLLLITITALAWIAGYGWRRAVGTLISLLQRLEQL